MKSRKRALSISIIIISIVIIFCTRIILLNVFARNDHSAEQSILEDQRQRWMRHVVRHYRIVVERRINPTIRIPHNNRCRQDIEIIDERIVNVFENTCPGEPRTTVNTLFDEIDQQIELVRAKWVVSHSVQSRDGNSVEQIYVLSECGVSVDSNYVADVEFDTTFGYPRYYELIHKPKPFFDRITTIIGITKGCTAGYPFMPMIIVLEFTPIR